MVKYDQNLFFINTYHDRASYPGFSGAVVSCVPIGAPHATDEVLLRCVSRAKGIHTIRDLIGSSSNYSSETHRVSCIRWSSVPLKMMSRTYCFTTCLRLRVATGSSPRYRDALCMRSVRLYGSCADGKRLSHGVRWPTIVSTGSRSDTRIGVAFTFYSSLVNPI